MISNIVGLTFSSTSFDCRMSNGLLACESVKAPVQPALATQAESGRVGLREKKSILLLKPAKQMQSGLYESSLFDK